MDTGIKFEESIPFLIVGLSEGQSNVHARVGRLELDPGDFVVGVQHWKVDVDLLGPAHLPVADGPYNLNADVAICPNSPDRNELAGFYVLSRSITNAQRQQFEYGASEIDKCIEIAKSPG
jgi:hypothetical protein